MLAKEGKYIHPGRVFRLGKHDMLPGRKSVAWGLGELAAGLFEITTAHRLDVGFFNYLGYGTLAIGALTLLIQGGLALHYHNRMRS